jgi:hypothetical protein
VGELSTQLTQRSLRQRSDINNSSSPSLPGSELSTNLTRRSRRRSDINNSSAPSSPSGELSTKLTRRGRTRSRNDRSSPSLPVESEERPSTSAPKVSFNYNLEDETTLGEINYCSSDPNCFLPEPAVGPDDTFDPPAWFFKKEIRNALPILARDN